MKCQHCQWEIHARLDRFCGGCGRELVRWEAVVPAGEAIEVSPGRAVAVRLRNVGELPIALNEQVRCSWAIRLEMSDTVIAPGCEASVHLTLEHDVMLQQTAIAWLDSNAGPLKLVLRRIDPPLLIVEVEGRRLEESPKINEMLVLPGARSTASRYSVNIHLKGGVDQLLAADLLEAPATFHLESVVAVRDIGDTVSTTLRLTHEGELQRDAGLLTLRLSTQRLGPVTFTVQVKQIPAPTLVPRMDHIFTGDSALAVPATHAERFSIVIENSGTTIDLSAPQSKAPWLRVLSHADLTASEAGARNIDAQCFLIKAQIETSLLPEDRRQLEGCITLPYRLRELGQSGEAVCWVPLEVKPRQAIDFLAIDFGTSNTCAAFIDAFGRQDIISFPFNYEAVAQGDKVSLVQPDESASGILHPEVPTLLYLRSAGHTTDGEDLLRFELAPPLALRYDPGRALGTAFAWKKRLAMGMDLQMVSLHGQLKKLSARQLTKVFLQQALAVFRRNTAFEPRQLVITRPAHHDPAYRQALEEIVLDMGFSAPPLDLSEPEALGIHIITSEEYRTLFAEPRSYTIGIFDFGGGTTDLAILRFDCQGPGQGVCELVDTDGIPTLGGEELTFRIASFLRNQLEAHYSEELEQPVRFLFPEDFSDMLSQRGKARSNAVALCSIAEQFKTGYGNLPKRSNQSETLAGSKLLERHIFDGFPKEFTTELTTEERDMVLHLSDALETTSGESIQLLKRVLLCQEDIDEICQGPIEKALERLSNMRRYLFEDGKLDRFQLDYMILGGNSSRLPIVARTARSTDIAREVLHFAGQAKTGVALGAAKYGMLQHGISGGIEIKRTSRLMKTVGLADFLSFSPIFHKHEIPNEAIFELELVRKVSMSQLRVFSKSAYSPKDPATAMLATPDTTHLDDIPIPTSIPPGERFKVCFSLKDDATGLLFAIKHNQSEISQGEILLY